MLYLNNKQISQLLSPLVIVALLFSFQDDIVTFMHAQLPTYKGKIAGGNFNKEVSEYLNIGRDKQAYDDIFKKIEKRKFFAPWITKNLLYNKKSIQNDKQEKIKENIPVWNLQAVFPKHKMAIINSEFVSEGSIVDNAKIIKIKFDSILIKTKKGLQWVHLFH